MSYKIKIGMEVHVELATESKMFCDCVNNSEEKEPNTNVCPVCMGYPGTLPVANRKAIEAVILAGLALNCQINKLTKFDRKNYFYPDIPKGYQISQYDLPISYEGFLNVGDKKIGITRIHLEEDTGKLQHPKGADYSLVDYNRAGAPLMELVTEPDIASAVEAKKFCQELQLILRYLRIAEANMEKGEMRCEVNVSISNSEKDGTKVEVKNLNSFKAVERSILYEFKRQSEVLDKGEEVIQETRGWDEVKQQTISQRSKESAHDYRYFPEPDLPPYEFDKQQIEDMKQRVPELPEGRRQRFQSQYGLPWTDIDILVADNSLGDFYENAISELFRWFQDEKQGKVEEKAIRLASNYLITELRKLMYEDKATMGNIKITPENFAEFVTLVYQGKVSSSGAQALLREMFVSGGDPSQIMEVEDLSQTSDVSELEQIVKKILEENPKPVEDYKKGNVNALQFVVGQTMKATKGKANPQVVMNIAKKILG